MKTWKDYTNPIVKYLIQNFVYTRAQWWVSIKDYRAAAYSPCDRFMDNYQGHMNSHFSVAKDENGLVLIMNDEPNYAVLKFILVDSENRFVDQCSSIEEVQALVEKFKSKAKDRDAQLESVAKINF